ncbi:MAG: hypothetical protein R6U43_05555 [Candidatus Krumholzibacteriales bacterium]
MKNFIISALILILPASSAELYAFEYDQESTLMIELEGGPLWQTVNDIQIPNSDQGTRFSLADLAGKGPYPAGRMYITWNINRRHGLRLLLAPFSITETIQPDDELKFEGESFIAGEPVEATYKFNSWRVSYRYRFRDGDKVKWYIGFTAKVRDAKIELVQSGASSDKPDIGFVPLLHLGMDWRISRRWRFAADLDALAGGPGRAEDFSVKLRYMLTPGWSIAAGYRTLEGGADVDEVYSFAWLHYAVVSLTYSY